MNYQKRNEQRRDINFTLSLLGSDAERLWYLAGTVGLTPEKLLASFIGDLIDGADTNGSDERMYAEMWFDRCGFSHFVNKTFLIYLLTTQELEGFISNETWIAEIREDLTAAMGGYEEGVYDSDEVASLGKELAFHQEHTASLYVDYLEWCGENPPVVSMDEEIATVHGWIDRK